MAIIATNKTKTTSKTPHISVNKLGEYIVANATRRRQILKDQKYPQDYITTLYKEVREAIVRYIRNNLDTEIINNAIGNINESELSAQNKALSKEMLNKVLDTDLSILEGYNFTHYAKAPKLEIAKVKISVYPDLILQKEKKNIPNIGALKIHITKKDLEEESQKIISTILHNYTKEYIIKGGQSISRDMCLSYNVYNGALECSPSSHKRRMKEVEAACEEIARGWDAI